MLGEMPYANLKIALKKAVEYEVEKVRQEKINSAFIGWQYAIWQPLKKGKRHDDFERYCRKMGISSHRGGLTSEVVDAERERAAALFEKALGKNWSEKPVDRRKMV